MLTPSVVGDNPQQPGISAQVFNPDQLIAGNAKVITDTVLIGGGAVLQRGALLGQVAYGALSASAGTANAAGSVIVAAVPAVGDLVTIAGSVITFVAANPVGNQVVVGATAAATAYNLIEFLAASADANLIKMTYSLSGSTISAVSVVAGTAGNAYTLTTSNATAFTVSGATLTGGVANTGNATVGTMSLGPKARTGVYSAVCTAATTAQVNDPNGVEIGVATFGTQFVDPQISFRITAGGTPCVAGDTFLLVATAGSGAYVLSLASATDGSQSPIAILADLADPTGGNVNGPVYIAGEFNVNAMTFGAGQTPGNTKAGLRILGIYLKNAVTAADPS